MQFSDRLKPIAHNVFADMDKAKSLIQGHSLIDLSLGSSDLPTSPKILEAISTALKDPQTHGYSLFASTKDFRIAVSNWLINRFGITVDPETEVLPLIGSQEGTAHLPLAILNPGDYALLQDPGYPSHYGGIHLASGQIYGMPLRAGNQYLPVFADIPKPIVTAAKMMVLSYPHNPTTAIASLEFLQSAVAFCQLHNLVLVHDFPYLDLVFNGAKAPSILQADPDRSVSIEFFTLSKSYNMGGFRVGFAVGNRNLIQALREVKAVVDFNQYQGIMRGAIAALNSKDGEILAVANTFKHRRDVMVNALHTIGWDVPIPDATMYIWAQLPQQLRKKFDSVKYCLNLIQSTGVALSPGNGFGKCGEGYVRLALVHPPELLTTAAQRIGDFNSGQF
ncbi:aspartate/tyrosine/aromatic aminotransferase [Synechococcus sp. PCC 7502]|uniref:LL-diaminopimelate aminotransferase n=1 Tax=Synechococcus sp. PCC 7502 TaxID=1173263 RepID=UPI00029FE6D2|nr:LL-diaminopimelate aminotransferase [Synechococcus sp. PCC 7502]AFY72618.1 aspartate/tyrosine/aromatic aminotransferase [Synechococcus sp. PCC 7502]